MIAKIQHVTTCESVLDTKPSFSSILLKVDLTDSSIVEEINNLNHAIADKRRVDVNFTIMPLPLPVTESESESESDKDAEAEHE